MESSITEWQWWARTPSVSEDWIPFSYHLKLATSVKDWIDGVEVRQGWLK